MGVPPTHTWAFGEWFSAIAATGQERGHRGQEKDGKRKEEYPIDAGIIHDVLCVWMAVAKD